MIPRRFIMEDWLAACKDTCAYNLGESGMPDLTVGDCLARCGLDTGSLRDIVLRDEDTRGSAPLRHAIAATYGPPVTDAMITVTTGTSEALYLIFALLLEHGGNVVAPFPAFQALYEVPRALGQEVRFYHLDEGNGFRPDPEEIAHLIDDDTVVVVLNTPHNPSGVFIPRETADAIAETARRHGAVVLADEHYRFLPMDDGAPARSLADPKRGIIATGSITKCFGSIGLRMGWVVAPPELIERIRDFRDYITHTLSPVSDFLSRMLLDHAAAFIGPAREAISANRRLLAKAVAETPGLSLVLPEGGVVAFPRYAFDVDTETFARGLIDRHGVFVLPGSAFETSSHFRINLGKRPDEFAAALTFIRDYCRTLEL